MFCSGEELGINDDWYDGASVNGILILKEDYPLGVEVKELLELEDVIFDINVTANRPDCQSILGIAREVSAVLGKKLKMPNLTYAVSDFSSESEDYIYFFSVRNEGQYPIYLSEARLVGSNVCTALENTTQSLVDNVCNKIYHLMVIIL